MLKGKAKAPKGHHIKPEEVQAGLVVVSRVTENEYTLGPPQRRPRLGGSSAQFYESYPLLDSEGKEVQQFSKWELPSKYYKKYA